MSKPCLCYRLIEQVRAAIHIAKNFDRDRSVEQRVICRTENALSARVKDLL